MNHLQNEHIKLNIYFFFACQIPDISPNKRSSKHGHLTRPQLLRRVRRRVERRLAGSKILHRRRGGRDLGHPLGGGPGGDERGVRIPRHLQRPVHEDGRGGGRSLLQVEKHATNSKPRGVEIPPFLLQVRTHLRL